jgi:ABC-type multidrug transport system permease subunit
LTVALELPMLKREHFNRWYTVGSYYLALSFVDLPALILNNFIYVTLTYYCTGQPLEIFRFSIFMLVSILVAYTSQGLGIFASSVANTMQRSLIIASSLIMMFCTFSGFFILMKDAATYFHIFFKLSFLKHAIDACFLGIFGYGRRKMDCFADYCHFRWPHKFLTTLGVDTETDIRWSIGIIVLSLIIFRIAAFLAIKKRIEIS